MKKTLLFGEPMALLLADTPGALEGVEHFTRRMSGAEVNVAIGLTRLGFPCVRSTSCLRLFTGRWGQRSLQQL